MVWCERVWYLMIWFNSSECLWRHLHRADEHEVRLLPQLVEPGEGVSTMIQDRGSASKAGSFQWGTP